MGKNGIFDTADTIAPTIYKFAYARRRIFDLALSGSPAAIGFTAACLKNVVLDHRNLHVIPSYLGDKRGKSISQLDLGTLRFMRQRRRGSGPLRVGDRPTPFP